MLRNDTQKYKKRYASNSLQLLTDIPQSSCNILPFKQHRFMNTMRSQKNTHFKVQSLQKNIFFKQSSQKQYSDKNSIKNNNQLGQNILLRKRLDSQFGKQLKIKLHLNEFVLTKANKKAVNIFQNTLTSDSSKQQLMKISEKRLRKQKKPQSQPLQTKNNLLKIKVKPLNDQSIRIAKQNSQQLLRELKINDLFFCSKCLLYVFKIQVKYHFPICSNSISVNTLSSQQKINLGWQKLDILMQLAEQTSIKVDIIKSKLKDYKREWNSTNRNLSCIEDQDKDSSENYYFLEDIDKAMQITYNLLLKNTQKSQSFCML